MYFEDNSDLAHDWQRFEVTLLAMPMIFETDSGVFSKSAIDYGSKVLIENFQPKSNGKTLLDVGCGYGPMGISLAKKYGLAATMSDVNPRALELTEKNLTLNDLVAEVVSSDRYLGLADRKFDMIVTNPPIRAGKAVVHGILSEAYDHLEKNGELTAVIQKKQGAPSAEKKMLEIFGNCEIIVRDKGYWLLKSTKN